MGKRFEAAFLKTAHQINAINNEIHVYDYKTNLFYFIQKCTTSSTRLTVGFNYWKQLYFIMKISIYTT